MAKRKKRQRIAESIDTDAKAIVFAHSIAATPLDSIRAAVFQCVVDAFSAVGMNQITGEADKIVWQIIPDPVIDQLGTLIRGCVRQRVKDPGDLIGPFAILKDNNRVTTVGDLVDAIVALVS